ncbi:MAG: tail fiber protein [Byssovorax sp.]
MSEPFLGEIRTFGGNFAPKSWAPCDGRLLPIAQYSALFSILGTTYGGDGIRTFALPNLNGNAPMHWGDGPGLTPRSIGETGGSATVTLTSAEMPAHNHPFTGSGAAADQPSPAGSVLAEAALYAAPPLAARMADGAVNPAGASQPHDNLQPYLGLTFIIALQGIFPPRG